MNHAAFLTCIWWLWALQIQWYSENGREGETDNAYTVGTQTQ